MGFVDHFVEWAHANLSESDEARSFLLGRGVSEDQWERHQIGFVAGDFGVDPSLDPGHNSSCGERFKKGEWCDSCRYAHWSAEWIEPEDEPKHPVMGRRIVGSVVLPLTNYAGSRVGFQTRKLGEKAYDTFLLRHRPEGYFFGVAQSIESIWSRREAWMVEGPFDHLILERLVAPNVVGLTTSSPSRAQTLFLARFAETVNSCLDMDAAGRKGFRSFFKYNYGKFAIRDVDYPRVRSKDKDLGDFWKAVGDDAFRRYFRERVISRF